VVLGTGLTSRVKKGLQILSDSKQLNRLCAITADATMAMFLGLLPEVWGSAGNGRKPGEEVDSNVFESSDSPACFSGRKEEHGGTKLRRN
jgi:hypothetical protein